MSGTTPKGYTPEDLRAASMLTDQLMELTAQYHPKVGMSALLSAYMRHAVNTGTLVGAAEHLVSVGGGVLMTNMLAAASAEKEHRAQVLPAAGRIQ
ncbi:MAG: hypothetical protein KF796_19195 [Ramlibacter sp.]|nr:hypothetical protein [Ramlibacter sp.]